MEYEHGKLSNYHLSEGLSSTLVEHLSQQLESYKCELSGKREEITVLHTELADKEDLIRDQLDTINEYREEMVRLGDNMYEARYCPVLENKRKMRRARGSRGGRPRPGRRTRPRLEAAGRDRSLESESLSEPEAGVSLARIGLPLSYPDNPDNCSCDRNNLLSDSDDKQSKFEIFFLKYFDVATLLVYC